MSHTKMKVISQHQRYSQCETDERIPDEDSSLSSLLTNQSKLLENWVQLFLFPLISAAVGHKERVHESIFQSVA